MGLFTMMFGRNKLKRPEREKFFSVITAEVALSSRMDLRSTHKAGLVFNPVESSFFENLDDEIRSLLQVSESATGTQFRVVDDTFGTRWAALEDRDFEDLVSTIHLISETVIEHGFAERLLAAVFGVEYEGKRGYWIYNYKRGNFYPMVLSGSQTRDNAAEMRLSAVMEEERIPVERSLENWYALWGIPF